MAITELGREGCWRAREACTGRGRLHEERPVGEQTQYAFSLQTSRFEAKRLSSQAIVATRRRQSGRCRSDLVRARAGEQGSWKEEGRAVGGGVLWVLLLVRAMRWSSRRT